MRSSIQDKYDNRRRPPRQPLLNVPQGVAFLVYICLAVHVVRMFLPRSLDNAIISYGGFIPARFMAMIEGVFGISVTSVISNIVPLFSYNFLHGDWMHLIFNLLWLMVFGSIVGRRLGEDREGLIRLLEIFFLSAIGGALFHMVFYLNGVVPLIGGSAGVAGLMGASARILFATYEFSPNGRPHIAPVTEKRVLAFSAVFVGINLVIGFMGGGFLGAGNTVAWQAHIGGFVVGLMIYPFFDRISRR